MSEKCNIHDITKLIMPEDSKLINEVRQMIKETRSAVAATVNAGLSMLYWRIGKRINKEILKGERAEYGGHIIADSAARRVDRIREIDGKALVLVVERLIEELGRGLRLKVNRERLFA